MVLYLQLLSFIESGRFEKGGMRNLIHKALWSQLPKQERKLLLVIHLSMLFSNAGHSLIIEPDTTWAYVLNNAD
ncbi:hypothetical protein EQM13_17105 [Acidilutibacter cellobiosedens]|jgi:uncharacterized membrane protein YhhN|uniref:Uncharacterized protein n=1 Tax=Acidilutibacter cellobiosedens TaxID=2507161 RepID=A0A410QH46_9FIRM|nr:hypothetical protein [Acidilutibacter cellobiosedens]QAT63164.1 hypothetical protein EQM13_17105 [Acidilutibacter cellobiosedens]